MNRVDKIRKGNLLTGLAPGLQLSHAEGIVDYAVEQVVVLLQVVPGYPVPASGSGLSCVPRGWDRFSFP